MSNKKNKNSNKPLVVHVTTVPITLWAFFHGQIEYLKRNGYKIVGVSSPGPLLDKVATEQYIPVYGIQMNRRIAPLKDIVSLLRLYKLFRELSPDIVHSHTPKASFLSMIAARMSGVPVRIYTIHGLPLLTRGKFQRTFLIYIERLVCKVATNVLCVSPSLRQLIIRLRICPAYKIKVLKNGSINGVEGMTKFNKANFTVDDGLRLKRNLNIPINSVVLAYVGRLVIDKGIAELTSAWQILRKEFPELVLLMVGEYESEDPLPPEIKNILASDDRIFMTGFVYELPKYYNIIDIIILPSYREGFPIVALEAAAMEVPVIATRIVGASDFILDSVTGKLILVKDPSAIVESVRELITDKSLRKKMGQQGRRWVLDNYKPSDIWRALYEEYETLIHSLPN